MATQKFVSYIKRRAKAESVWEQVDEGILAWGESK